MLFSMAYRGGGFAPLLELQAVRSQAPDRGDKHVMTKNIGLLRSLRMTRFKGKPTNHKNDAKASLPIEINKRHIDMCLQDASIDTVAVIVAVADYSADNDDSKPCISTEQLPFSNIA